MSFFIESNEDAAKFIEARRPVMQSVWERLAPGLRMRAISVAGVNHFESLQIILDTLATVPRGGDWKEARMLIAATIAEQPGFVDPAADAEERSKQERKAIQRAELTLRTHVYQAYAAGRWEAVQEFRDVFPYLQYLTVGDSDVRDAHAALNELIVPADSPFWNTHFPPWDYNCRCQTAQLTAEEAGEVRQAEAGMQGDRKLLVEGPLLDKLESGQVLRAELTAHDPNDPDRASVRIKGGGAFDVRSPAERPDGSGYRFSPGDLRLPWRDTVKEWTPEAQAEFEAWAKRRKTAGPNTPTVYDWLEGEDL